MTNILSIGNSFSQDAHAWLKELCESAGKDIYNVNLYFPSCSLERHWNNFTTDNPEYDCEIAGVAQRKISISEALKLEKWDVITFQQASDFCGQPESYEPYLSELVREARKICPEAKIYIHQTWAYEIDSKHGPFVNYHCNQKEMYERLVEAYRKAGESIGVELIPVGDVIQYLREKTPEFDYQNGGLSLNRDGFHLTLLEGRYAAALTWYGCLFGEDVRNVSFVPKIEAERADMHLLNVVKEAVYTVLKER